MTPASARYRRVVLALWFTLAAYVASPLAGLASAEDNGLGAGGASFAFNFTLVIGIILAFIFGFAIRDYLQKRALRGRSAKKPSQAPPRT